MTLEDKQYRFPMTSDRSDENLAEFIGGAYLEEDSRRIPPRDKMPAGSRKQKPFNIRVRA